MPDTETPAPGAARFDGRTALPWLGGVAVAFGVAAAFSTGLPRRLALLLLFASALLTTWAAGRHAVTVRGDDVLGGAGYAPPRQAVTRWLHGLITVLYNLGVIVVTFAAMARFEWIDVDFGGALVRDFPVVLGLFVLTLAMAARNRIEERGGILRTWYTRVHGWLLAVVSVPVLALGVWLAVQSGRGAGSGVFVEADLVVLVLVGVLGVGTQLLLAAGLPTTLDLAMRLFRRDEEDVPSEGTPPFVYAIALSLGVMALVGFILSRFSILDALGGFQDQRIAYLLVLFPVGLGVFFLLSAVAIWREGRRGLYKQKISGKLRNDILVYGLSSLSGLVFAVLLVAVVAGKVDRIGPFEAGNDLAKDLILLTVLVTAGPVGWYLHHQHRRVDHIESRLPDFLNDLAETRRAGLTLASALQSTAMSDYGALSVEVKKMAHQVSWGVPFTEALKQFADRVKTSLVQRSAYLIIEASKTGGSVAEILKAAAKDAYELKSLESDRRVTMMTYLIVIYVVFFVFMVVIAVLDVQFIPQVLGAQEATAAAGSGLGGGSANVDQEALRFIYYNAAIVQAVGNGLVAGVLSEGRVTAGLRHVAIMTLVAWLVFRMMLTAL